MQYPAGTMPLRGLTNTPSHQAQNSQNAKHSTAAKHLVDSDETAFCSMSSISDSIYDAYRVASNEEPSTVERIENVPRPTGTSLTNTGDHRKRQAQSEGKMATTKSLKTLSRNSMLREHCRSWSVNDLDCAAQPGTLFSRFGHKPSPSSNEALEAAANSDHYPHLPSQPPLCRRVTPEGIPSFGSRKAQELRLIPLSRLDRLSRSLRQRLRGSEQSQSTITTLNSVLNTTKPIHGAATHAQLSGPTEILRRISGMMIPVSVAAGPPKPRTVALPRGLRIASTPGDLAVADDGSHVRGRFGYRVSGHGVGQRTVDLHPLARRREASGIEETVRAIDKACAQPSSQVQRRITSTMSESPPHVYPDQDHIESQAESSNHTVRQSVASQIGCHEHLMNRALETWEFGDNQLHASLRSYQTPYTGLSMGPALDYGVCSPYFFGSSRNTYHSTAIQNHESGIAAIVSNNISFPRMLEPTVYGRQTAGLDITQRNLTQVGVMETVADEHERGGGVEQVDQIEPDRITAGTC